MSIIRKISRMIRKITSRLTKKRNMSKGDHEINYWKKVKNREGEMGNRWYHEFFTTQFGYEDSFYNGKKILDIGCGPRGSLEWADMAEERVGLDSIVDRYEQLGIRNHKMKYVNSGAENIPFPDGYFDVVSSFNSLDHVDDIDKSISEIIRVTAPGGVFLLLTDVNHDPTPAEPVSYSFDIIEKFKPFFKIEMEKHYEKQGKGMYNSIREEIEYNYSDPKKRYGILQAKLIRNAD